ncbi:MAG: hypothetical protein IJ630_11090 [Treponema sp.]|nr:hypothetical protein [Treponema sp.]
MKSGVKFFLSVLTFLLPVCFLQVSCLSTNLTGDRWRSAQNLDELYGIWVSSTSEYVYPVEIDGKKYLRISYAKANDTEKWKKFASENDMDMSDLWQKRFSLASVIYSTSEKTEILPDSDENGTQKGRKFFIDDSDGGEKIFSRQEILIPENLVAINLNFFLIRRDSFSLRENGEFHLVSNKFTDIKASENLFYKMQGEKQK